MAARATAASGCATASPQAQGLVTAPVEEAKEWSDGRCCGCSGCSLDTAVELWVATCGAAARAVSVACGNSRALRPLTTAKAAPTATQRRAVDS